MTALHQKLERLKQKQVEIERRLAAQTAAEHAVVCKAFRMILSASSNVCHLVQTSSSLDTLSVRERAAFDNWFKRIEGTTSPHGTRSIETNSCGSTENQSALLR